jgi:hypothetical protein
MPDTIHLLMEMSFFRSKHVRVPMIDKNDANRHTVLSDRW